MKQKTDKIFAEFIDRWILMVIHRAREEGTFLVLKAVPILNTCIKYYI